MKKLFLSIALMFLGLFSVQTLASPIVVAQFDPLEKPCEGISAGDSADAICKDSDGGTTDDPLTGDDGVITDAANILSIVAGIIAVIIIMVAGITMMTSSGDAAKVKNSRNAIIYTTIGIVVVVLARTIVIFVFDRLIKS